MRENKLHNKLAKGELTIGTRIHISHPTIMEIIGQTGAIDYVEFVGEYSPYDLYDLEHMARASELTGISTMMKVDQPSQRYFAQRALRAGIQNIMFADIRSVEDAKKCVEIVRAETPETGGLNPCAMGRNVGHLREPGSKDYVKAMDEAVVALTIEKKSAVESLDEILSLDGVEMVQFGPCDYAMSLGLTGQMNHPRVKEAKNKMIEMALEKGVAPRVEIDDVEEVEEYIDMGVRHFSIGVDIVTLHNWLKEKGNLLRENILKD